MKVIRKIDMKEWFEKWFENLIWEIDFSRLLMIGSSKLHEILYLLSIHWHLGPDGSNKWWEDHTKQGVNEIILKITVKWDVKETLDRHQNG